MEDAFFLKMLVCECKSLQALQASTQNSQIKLRYNVHFIRDCVKISSWSFWLNWVSQYSELSNIGICNFSKHLYLTIYVFLVWGLTPARRPLIVDTSAKNESFFLRAPKPVEPFHRLQNIWGWVFVNNLSLKIDKIGLK